MGSTAAARAEGMAGRWVVSFEADGVLEIRTAAGFSGSTSGITYRVEGGLLHTNALVEGPGCQATGAFVGVYRWARDENELRFTAVEDDCPARRLLFQEQVWERLPG